jgi:predicted DNA-binding protein (UPF0251 family)
MHDLEKVVLTIDEFEALRLADLEGLHQEAAGKQMNVSRQTFGNIIDSAHKKIADCLVNGKAVKIEGGVYAMGEMREFRCSACHHKWEEAHGTGRPGACPQCGSENIHRAPEERGQGRSSRGRARMRCGRRSK